MNKLATIFIDEAMSIPSEASGIRGRNPITTRWDGFLTQLDTTGDSKFSINKVVDCIHIA